MAAARGPRGPGGAEGLDGQALQLCALRELYHGRFTDEEAAILLELNEGDSWRAAHMVNTSEAHEIRHRLEQNKWTVVESARRNVRNSTKRSVLGDARKGVIDTSKSLFACAPCDNVWWRKTPMRKEVSRCNKCKTKYDPVPKHLEWGWAMFQCQQCNNKFSGWCSMGMTSPCYGNGCHAQVYPECILPPKGKSQHDETRQRRTTNTHSCGAWDCINPKRRRGPPVLYECCVLENHTCKHRCLHPTSRSHYNIPKVVNPSPKHDSTGSTVNTFLPQGSEDDQYEVFAPQLPSIAEEDGADAAQE